MKRTYSNNISVDIYHTHWDKIRLCLSNKEKKLHKEIKPKEVELNVTGEKAKLIFYFDMNDFDEAKNWAETQE